MKFNIKLIFYFSSLIFIGLFLSSVFYILFSDDKSAAISEVWTHFKTLSLLVAGYIFRGKVKT